VYDRKTEGTEFQILKPARVKLRAPSEVWTNGTGSRLVLDNLREWVEWWASNIQSNI